MAYSDNVQQPGLLSAFAILQEQSALNVYTPGSGNLATVGTPPGSLGSTGFGTPEWLDIETFTVTDDPAIIQFDVMQKSRDTLQSTRSGVHKVQAMTTMPFYGLMGAQIWKCLLGSDTYVPAASNVASATSPIAKGATQLTGLTMPALPTGLTGTTWEGTWITLDPGTSVSENVLILSLSGTTAQITATKYAHSAASVFLNPPAAPVPTASTTGGALAAGTYGIEFTYVNAQGETLPGPSASFTIASGTAGSVTAPSPAAEGSATSYKVYVTSPGGTTYYPQGSAITIGTGFSLTVALTTTGSAPTTNTASDATGLVNVSQPGQHVINSNTGTAQPTLPTVFAIAQFANFYEWQIPFGYVSRAGLTGDTKTIKMDANFSFQTIPLDPVAAGYQNGITSYLPSVAEATDSPFIMRDGGVVAPYSTNTSDPAGGGAPVARNRLLSLNFEIDNGLIAREYGGGVQNAEVYIPGPRKPSIKFREDAGQYSVGPAMHTNYVKTQASIPTYLAFQNPLAGTAWGAFFPKCQVIKYDPITAMADPLAFDGEFLPLRDPTHGYMVRISIVNSSTSGY